MDPVNRKIKYRMYPNASQSIILEKNLALHCKVYNAFLEEKRTGPVCAKRPVPAGDGDEGGSGVPGFLPQGRGRERSRLSRIQKLRTLQRLGTRPMATAGGYSNVL